MSMKTEAFAAKKKRIPIILAELDAIYTEADCTLEFTDTLQLLISTQLAAQCTDARVNIVAQTLYQKYRTVDDFANADIAELEQEIKSTGFFRNKARNIILCCQKIIRDYNGSVPNTMEELLTLPGVGRKTANLVLGDAFHIPGIVVDTHTGRLSRRLGLTSETLPEKVEIDLMKILPRKSWTLFGHQLVLHGRAVCSARKPACDRCTLSEVCPKIGVVS